MMAKNTSSQGGGFHLVNNYVGVYMYQLDMNSGIACVTKVQYGEIHICIVGRKNEHAH